MTFKIKPQMEQYRLIKGPFKSNPNHQAGLFMMPFQSNMLNIVASDGEQTTDWEHVSVSLKNRCPNWMEMCEVKSMFWDEEDTVVQFHPPKSKYSNNHPYCLHMFRNKNKIIELPPTIITGIKEKEQN